MRKRKPIIILLIIDILAIVLIVCNVKFAIFNKMATAISKVLHPQQEYNITPHDRTKPTPSNPDTPVDPSNPDNPDEPEIVINYPLEVTFDGMGGTVTGETSFYLDGTEKTIDDLIYPEIEYLEYEFIEWEKEEYIKVVDHKIVYVWEYYAIWEYSPIDYYTRILSSSSFNLSGSTYTLDVDKNTTSCAILSNFKYRNNVATAELYSDSTCTNEVTDENVNIEPGYNYYWLKIDAGIHGTAVWKVEVYRVREYSVTFTVSGLLDSIPGLEDFVVKEKDNARLSRISSVLNIPGYAFTPSVSLNTLIDHDMDVNINVTYANYSVNYANTLGATNTNATHFDMRDEFELTPIEKFGYVFNGWTLNGEPITKVNVGTTNNLTITANWTIITWNISYDLGGGVAEPNAESYTVEDNVVLNTPIKGGFVFSGWNIYDENDNPLAYDPAFKYYKNVKVVATYTQALTSSFYGKYPQERVTDDGLIGLLDSMTPVNGIYSVGGNEYVKQTAHAFLDGLKFRDGTPISNGTDYYFKLCPIEWVEMKVNDNEYTLMSKYVLDADIFDETTNNYINSQLFTQLNGKVNLLFSENELLNLKQYEISNAYDTVNPENFDEANTWTYDSGEGYICIPSYYDVSTYLTEANTLITDYAIAKGCLFNPTNYNAFYFYRSPYSETREKYVAGYNASGDGSANGCLDINTIYGLRLVICVESGEKTE